VIKRAGIKITIIGEDYIPKSSSLITPNHVSNADAFIMMSILGDENLCSAVGKKELEDHKFVNGYIGALETFLLDPKDIRSSLGVIEAAGK
jgi:1-acyl-sn-glycerol-3-phosphate acyltransferase